MTARLTLDVVMPVYNESEILRTVLDDVCREVLDRIGAARLIVVDDCSRDGSLDVLRAAAGDDDRILVLVNEVNVGHGRSVRRGLDTATADWVLQIDSDGQIDLGDFVTLWSKRNQASLVIGRRVDRSDPRHRLILTRVTRLIVSALCGRRITDGNVPFKLVERSLLDRLLPIMPSDAFAPSIMLVVGACSAHVTPCEVPVRHLPRPFGHSTLRPMRLAAACLTAGRQTLAFTWRARRAFRRE